MSSKSQSAINKLINSPAGPKTVHFWAPVMKWALVIAGFKDLQRPVEKISGTQQFALMATGLIWTRWSMVIKPKNYLLASVNAFLGGVAGLQVSRLYNWRRKEGDTPYTAFQYIIGTRTLPQQEMKTEKTTAETTNSLN